MTTTVKTGSTANIDSLLREATERGSVPGVVAAAATDDGILYEGAHGERELGTGQPMTPDTVMWFASMTKAVTGTAAMQLVERGALSLDAPASEVLPYLGEVKVLEGFDDDGEPVLREPRGTITLRNLLTHTSGFVYDIWNEELLRYGEITGCPGIITCQNAALEVPLAFDPGERWEYGIGIDWAGKMVEAVTGQRLGDYLRQHIFEPLGMEETTFRPTDEQRSRRASVHARTPDGLEPIPFDLPEEPEFEMGGGGLFSVVGDYLRFLRMILNDGTGNGEQILRPTTVEDMYRNHIGDLSCHELVPAIPSFSNPCDFFPGMDQKWGLTFLINTADTPEGRSAGSVSWAGLANSYYWIDPTKAVTGVLATQIIPFFDGEAVSLFRSFEAAVYDAVP